MSQAPSGYHPNKIRPLIKLTARMIKDHPHLLHDDDPNDPGGSFSMLITMMEHAIPALRDKTKCPNCKGSMAEYEYTLDIFDAMLIKRMGDAVDDRCRGGMPFTEANSIHVSSMEIPYPVRCRTTQCAKLGLIAKHFKNKKRVNGHWVLTDRGFEALRDQPVQKSVVVWHGEILERNPEKIRLSQVFAEHRESAKEKQRRGKDLKNDFTAEIDTYSPSDYYTISGYHQGEIL